MIRSISLKSARQDARGGRRVVPRAVVAVPVVAAAADLQRRDRRVHVLQEDAADELLAAGIARADEDDAKI
jgi:hypothetical protein